MENTGSVLEYNGSRPKIRAWEDHDPTLTVVPLMKRMMIVIMIIIMLIIIVVVI